MDLSEKVALVTGASSGIGLAVASALAGRGARVALVARTRSALEEAARGIGERAAAFPLDVTDRAALLQLPERVAERWGRLDVVVNNAGVNHRGAVAERTPEELADTVETNLVAPMLLARASLPHLSPGGAIVNVASLAGKVPLPEEAAYCASKAGLRAFARALQVELEPRGIRVATVNPGPVDTGFLHGGENVPDIVFSQPMSTAAEIARAVLRVLDGDEREVDVPALSGKLCTAGYLFPRLYAALRPFLTRRGARNRERYRTRKIRTPVQHPRR